MAEIKCPKCGTVFSIDDKEYDSIVKSIRDEEFNKSLEEKLSYERDKNKKDLELLKIKESSEAQRKLGQLEKQILSLKNELNLKDSENKLVLQKAVAEKEKEIDRLNNALLSQKNEEQARLKEKDEQIQFYKDLKTKMSTKLVGETLEQHCLNKFNEIRTTAFPNAYFEKDNDASSGSKGDFIFRDYTDQKVEYISIMFEMKNENDETATKHKNKDFFKELDKDRKEKGCEYAVLVSMLEPDSDLYNAGIVDVSYEYPKMYVVRPQCFISIISLLRNAALNSVSVRNELAVIKNQNLDITNFENELSAFKGDVEYNVGLAKKQYEEAIKEIDKTIAHLQKVRDSLTSSGNNLRIANDKVQSITVKKLTKNSPSLRKK